jgi:hypothetical protein
MVKKLSKRASTKTSMSHLKGDKAIEHIKLDNDQFVTQFVSVWKSLELTDLEVRHSLGTMLNGKYGAPQKRQSYGKGVFERLSSETGLSVSDLSLLRWFPIFGDNVAEIQQKYPEIVNWTAFKHNLPDLKSKLDLKVRRSVKRKAKSQAYNMVVKSLQNSLERLNSVDPKSVDRNDKSLMDVVRRIVKVMTKRFGFAVELVESNK